MLMKKIILFLCLLSYTSVAQSWEKLQQKGRNALKENRTTEALKYFEKASEKAIQKFGKESDEYFISQRFIAETYLKQNRYELSEKIYLEGLERLKKRKNSPEYYNYLLNITSFYRETEAYQKAAPILSELYEQCVARRGYHSEEYQLICNILAHNYRHLQQYEEAIFWYEKSLQAAEKLFGKQSENYANVLSNIASLQKDLGNYVEAEKNGLEVLKIREKLLGKTHEDYLLTLNHLASLYSDIGNYEKADKIYQELHENVEKNLGKAHELYAVVCYNMGSFFERKANWVNAERFYTKSLEAYRKQNPQSTNVAGCLTELGNLYLMQGLSDRAEKNLLEARELYQKYEQMNFAPHKNQDRNTKLLALLYEQKKEFGKAERLMIQNLAFVEKTYGNKSLNYASACQSLASFWFERNQTYHKAFELLWQAREIIAEKVGTNHINYALINNSLGVYFSKMENLRESEKYFSEALAIYEKNVGKLNPTYATLLYNLATTYEYQKKYEQAAKIYNEFMQIKIQEIFTLLPNLSEKEKINYLKSVEEFLESYYAFAINYYPQNPQMAENLLNLRLQLKAIVFLSMQQLQEDIAQSSDKELQQLYKQWKNKKQELYKALKLSPQELQDKKISLQELSFAIDDLERLLSEKSKSFEKLQRQQQSYTWQDLQKKLKDNEILVEIIRTRAFTSNKKFSFVGKGFSWEGYEDYLGVGRVMDGSPAERAGLRTGDRIVGINSVSVKSKSREEIQKLLQNPKAELEIIPFRQKEIQKISVASDSIFLIQTNVDTAYVAVLLDSKQAPQVKIFRNAGVLESEEIHLYRNFIRSRKIDKISYGNFWDWLGIRQGKVYFSPDGVYHQISLKTLFNPKTSKYLLEELDIHTLSTPRDILAIGNEKELAKQMENYKVYLFGYPDYSFGKKDKKQKTEKDANQYRNQRFWNNEGSISSLPGTRKEIESIVSLLKQAKIPHQYYLEEHANETNLKNVQNPYVLHIATHGFFLSQNDTLTISNQDINTILLKSGLLFAGAENALQSTEMTTEDGIFTALEVLNLDLENTELTVLSACETGLGEIQNGEGIFGLQRAFLQAGAKSILVSLWKVDDAATQEMMRLFYENLLIKKQEKHVAFANSQKKLREKYKEPYYWGAFVMIGE